MKNSDKVSGAEEIVIKMLLERVKLGKNLTSSKLRFRKCRFLLRNMHKACYLSPDMSNMCFFRLNPKTFFFNMNLDVSSRDAHKMQDRMA